MDKMLWTVGTMVMLGMASGASPAWQVGTLDVSQMLADVRVLANDSMEGRATGSRGNARARRYITDAFAHMALEPVYEGFSHSFDVVVSDTNSMMGSNIVGLVDGTRATNPFLVVSAHYDHLGV